MKGAFLSSNFKPCTIGERGAGDFVLGIEPAAIGLEQDTDARCRVNGRHSSGKDDPDVGSTVRILRTPAKNGVFPIQGDGKSGLYFAAKVGRQLIIRHKRSRGNRYCRGVGDIRRRGIRSRCRGEVKRVSTSVNDKSSVLGVVRRVGRA